ncbi:MAG TPA: 4-hydroxyphenylpyruvate dioxygenase, partial [Sphingomonadales bacterium]|nr:4-hydroxyphenylpyruvate dioxygenase [Sphingomonadales bacterium]
VLHGLFRTMGFTLAAKHKRENLFLYKQGDITFIVNEEPGNYAQAFARKHGPSACAMAFRVTNAKKAFAEAVRRGAKPVEAFFAKGETPIPVVEGIGGTRLYLTEWYGPEYPFGVDFVPVQGADERANGAGLTYLDHLTHNVFRGNMNKWAKFYQDVFNFREIRYFDIEGKLTGLLSRAMTSPCGKIRIPINESQDDKSQIAEYLKDYNGEGIQHIALGTNDIFETVDALRQNGIVFQDTPDTYYEMLPKRVKGHGESLSGLQKRRILMDGAPTEGQGLLLQIFTINVLGPIFFEIIQRKGNEGFGEGNFKALFESIELDQIRRGVLKAE